MLRCPPSVMLPSMTEAMGVDPLAGKEVLLALKRLVGKRGHIKCVQRGLKLGGQNFLVIHLEKIKPSGFLHSV